jgi:hypothetical protein
MDADGAHEGAETELFSRAHAGVLHHAVHPGIGAAIMPPRRFPMAADWPGIGFRIGFRPAAILDLPHKLASFCKIHICQSPPCRVTHIQVSYITHLACFVKGRATAEIAEIGLSRVLFLAFIGFSAAFSVGFSRGKWRRWAIRKTDPHNRRPIDDILRSSSCQES